MPSPDLDLDLDLKPDSSSGAPEEEAGKSPASLAVLLKTLAVLLLFGITHHFHLHFPPEIQVAGVLAASLLLDAIERVAKRLDLRRRHVAGLDAVILLWDSIDKKISQGVGHVLPSSTTKALTNIGSKLNGMPVLKVLVTSAGALAVSAAVATPIVLSQHPAQAPLVRFSATPDAAADTNATYAVTFTAVGKLTNGYSQIRLVAPPGTVLPGSGCNYHSRDNTTGIGSQACLPVTLSNSGATATITIGNDAAAGDSVTIVVDEVTNPPSGSYTIGVATSSDGALVSLPFDVTAPG
jgi:hypothetical protein